MNKKDRLFTVEDEGRQEDVTQGGNRISKCLEAENHKHK